MLRHLIRQLSLCPGYICIHLHPSEGFDGPTGLSDGSTRRLQGLVDLARAPLCAELDAQRFALLQPSDVAKLTHLIPLVILVLLKFDSLI